MRMPGQCFEPFVEPCLDVEECPVGVGQDLAPHDQQVTQPRRGAGLVPAAQPVVADRQPAVGQFPEQWCDALVEVDQCGGRGR